VRIRAAIFAVYSMVLIALSVRAAMLILSI
jgi:hypothetical protein